MKRILALILALVLTLSLCACGEKAETKIEGPVALHSNAYGYNSYSVHFAEDEAGANVYTYMDENAQTKEVPAADVETMLSRVVASCGDMTLDNRMLNLYYQQTLYDFTSQYASYLSYIMDTNVNLDEQMSMNGDMTWQESMLEAAFANFFQVSALYQQAQKEGFAMTEESQAFVDTLQESLNAAAVSAGFADENEYLQDTFGPGITFDVYAKFSEVNALAMDYANSLTEGLTFTEEELNTYYDENTDTFTQMGITKADKNVIDVRHILLTVEEGAEESVWTETEKQAQALLDEWKAGEATEEGFAALATEKTQDPGSAQTGGLYEDVYPGQMVAEFNNWCFDDARQIGDTGVVRTDYGYHVMYFAGEGDYIYWQALAESYLLSDTAAQLRADVTEQYEQSSDNAGVIVLEYSAPTVPSAETEEEEVALNPVEE